MDENPVEQVVSKEYFFPIPIHNPVAIYDSEGRYLGSATVAFVPGGIQVEAFVDKHRPEALDIEVGNKVSFRLKGVLDATGLMLVISTGV